MESRAWLVSYLQEAEEHGYPPPPAGTETETLRLMMRYVGDADPVLRDDLIYSTLHQWICARDCIPEENLEELLRTATDDGHLLFGVGNAGDDTVFTRTFSALVISLALARHRKRPFLSAQLFAETKDRLVRYYQSERDLRGYVPERGWAHGAAHAADALDELALCAQCSAETHREILGAVARLVRGAACMLCHHEDDRITNVIYSIHAAKLLPAGEMEAWLKGLAAKPDEGDHYARYVCMTNERNLMRSVYFRFLREGCDKRLLDLLIDLEGRLHRA